MAENEITTEKGSKNFPEAYIRFRTVLDALEITAMRYFLENKDERERVERAEEFEQILMPIIKKYQSQMMSDSHPGECPDGFFNCGGCCLAYPCP